MSKNLNNKDAESVALNISAVIVLGVMLIALVFVFVYPWAKSKHLEPVQQQITLTVKAADSTNVDMLSYSMEVDSMISIVTAKEDVLIKRYEYLLEQYKTEKEIRTTFSVIFGLIISLIGFLGYKSIREIKVEVKSKAEEIATSTATEKTKIYVNENAQAILTKKIEEILDNKGRIYQTLLGSIKEDIKNRSKKSNKAQTGNIQMPPEGKDEDLFKAFNQ